MARKLAHTYRLRTPFGVLFFYSKREAWAKMLKLCVKPSSATPATKGLYTCEFIPSGAFEFSMVVG